jgi:hypothetical protein
MEPSALTRHPGPGQRRVLRAGAAQTPTGDVGAASAPTWASRTPGRANHPRVRWMGRSGD